jgi:transposase
VFGDDRLDAGRWCVDDACMEQGIVLELEPTGGEIRGGRRWRTAEEKRRIVEETLEPGASVAAVARRHRINANQVFQWRRQYRAGGLPVSGDSSVKLLPVIVTDPEQAASTAGELSSGGAIHIEFPGRALVTIEAGVDAALAGVVIERLAR